MTGDNHKPFPDTIYVTQSMTNDDENGENFCAWADRDLAIEDACTDADERVAVYELIDVKRGKVARTLTHLDN